MQRVVACDVGNDGAREHRLVDRAAEEAPMRQRVRDLGVIVSIRGGPLHGDVGLLVVREDHRPGLINQRALDESFARAESLVEACKALRKIHLDDEGLVGRGEHGLVETVQRVGRLLRHPRRERQHLDLLVGQVEFVEAHQAVAALVGHLVVDHHLLDLVAEVVGLREVRRAMVVAVERHEDLVVVADQLFPQHLAVVGLERAGAVGVDVQQLVVHQDHGQGRVLCNHLARPGNAGVRDAPRQRQHHELLALRLEHVVLMKAAAVARAEGGLALGALGAKPLEIRLVGERAGGVGAAVRVDAVVHIVQHVVVAGEHAVGQLGVFEHLHRGIGHLPLVGLADLVDHIAQVNGERDVQRRGVGCDPFRLCGEGCAAEALVVLVALGGGGVARVELRVGHYRECEARDLRGDRRRGRCRCRSRRWGWRRGRRRQRIEAGRSASPTAAGRQQCAAAADSQQRRTELENLSARRLGRMGGRGFGRRRGVRRAGAVRVVRSRHVDGER